MTGKAKAPDPRRKDVSTARSTSGAGYDYEDQVGAWLLTRMLAGDPAPVIKGAVQALRFQTKAEGWTLDDLLLESADDGASRRLAISCKANIQVSAAGLPADFSVAAWALWRSPGPYRRDQDHMALVTQFAHAVFQPIWRDLKTWCEDDAEDTPALARIAASKPHAAMFDRLRSAGDAEPLDTVRLIKRVHVIPLDLQLDHSDNRDAAIGRCRDLLVTGDLETADALWIALVEAARQTRLGAGCIRLRDLLTSLRPVFRLRDHPDHAADWKTLNAASAAHVNRIQNGRAAGWTLGRDVLQEAVSDLIAANPVVAVRGASGAGKSALVRAALEARFAGARQVWLPPEALAALDPTALSAAALDHPLVETLLASPDQANILILDSVEKLSPALHQRARSIIDALLETKGEPPPWRVVVVGSAEISVDWSRRLLGPHAAAGQDIGPLEAGEVRAMLQSRQDIAWLAAHDAAVEALTNLRTLAWVCEAGATLIGETTLPVSQGEIADLLWRRWTDGDPAVQGLVMRLAQREAGFERSFRLSEMPTTDAAVLHAAANNLPMVVDARNRLSFAHDLAADLARFQLLKEIADDVAAWAPYAVNPMWTGALRMLGQYLLRSGAAGSSAWDSAFTAASKLADGGAAADSLLDALYLDPEADRFLEARRDLLLASNGRLLNRLLRRFHHDATSAQALGRVLDSDVALLIEESLRRPIYARWRSVAPFLFRNQAAIAALMSPVVASLCDTWLLHTPTQRSDGSKVLFREGFAALALASARRLQLAMKTGRFVDAEIASPIMAAAWRGAPDLPEAVAAWALEMARRRPLSAALAREVEAIKAEDAARRANEPAPLSSGGGALGSWRRRIQLPPWPHGPHGRIDDRFRRLVLHEQAALALYRVAPAVAVEVILAAMIEDSPEEESDSGVDRSYGLEADAAAHPTSFWRSPFFALLNVSPEPAIAAISTLVAFCTEHWSRAFELEEEEGEAAPSMTLTMPDRSTRTYAGDRELFLWVQEDSLDSGQLNSALDALERFLCSRIDEGVDVSTWVVSLLETTGSVGMLGVLVNVAKHQPDLLRGPLRSLFGSVELVRWDLDRIEHQRQRLQFNPDLIGPGAGETGAGIWLKAPHRLTTLVAIAAEWAAAGTVPDWLGAVAGGWPTPETPKGSLELRTLLALMDPIHYQPSGDGGDRVFVQPADLAADIEAFEAPHRPALTHLTFRYTVKGWLDDGRPFSPEGAASVAAYMESIAGDGDALIDHQETNAIAAASVLVLLGGAWLATQPEAAARVRAAIRTAALGLPATVDATRRETHLGTGMLDVLAQAVATLWVDEGRAWDAPVLAILTCGDTRATRALVETAHAHRVSLGARWWRLMEIAVWGAALFLLRPGHGDPDAAYDRWNRWLAWLRGRDLTASASIDSIDFADIQARLDRLIDDRSARDTDRSEWRRRRGRLHIRDGLLAEAFGWLVEIGQAPPVFLGDDSRLLLRLFDHLRPRLAQPVGSRQQPPVPNKFEYAVIAKIAELSLTEPADGQSWRRVIEVGPEAKIVVSRFLQGLFRRLTPQTSDRFFAIWTAMIDEVATSVRWRDEGLSYERARLHRQMLGFESPDALNRLDDLDRRMTQMIPRYAAWAAKNLTTESDNVAAFCRFLAGRSGRSLRAPGLGWIAKAFRGEPRPIHWGRDSGIGEAALGLLNVLLEEDLDAVRRDPALREQMLSISAELASRSVNGALSLRGKISRTI